MSRLHRYRSMSWRLVARVCVAALVVGSGFDLLGRAAAVVRPEPPTTKTPRIAGTLPGAPVVSTVYPTTIAASAFADRLFASDSPWNNTVPRGASYGGSDTDGNGVLDGFEAVVSGRKATLAGAINTAQFGIPVVVVDSTRPENRVVVDCRAPGKIEPIRELSLRFAVPLSYANDGPYGPKETFGSGPDSSMMILDRENRIGYDFFQLNPVPDSTGAFVQEGLGTLCEKGGYATYSLDGPGFGWHDPDHPNADSNGNVPAGIRAAGSPTAGGILTQYEIISALVGNTASIQHALAICLHADQLKTGWIFPAVSEDGWTGNYNGPFRMGTRLAIDPSTPMPDTVDTMLGRALWEAFVRYGGYVVDQCGVTSTFGLYADSNLLAPDINVGVSMADNGDLVELTSALRVVDPPTAFRIPATPPTTRKGT